MRISFAWMPSAARVNSVRIEKLLLYIVLLLLNVPAWANCSVVTSTSSLSQSAIAAGYTAASWTGACDTCSGNVGLPSVISINSGKTFQPSGTLLASSVGSFLSSASNVPYSANQILYRCAVADADSLYEMYATNGDIP